MAKSNLVQIARALISLVRSGWMLRGVPSGIAESVANHSFLTAYICIEIGSKIEGVNIGKLVLYSLLHDVSEAFTGDIAKVVSLRVGAVKKELELDLIEENVDNPLVKKMFREYLEQKDFESKVAKLCNYIATYLIGLEYKRLGYKVDDIIDNTYRDIMEMTKKYNLEEIVTELLNS
ncbi:MAG: HD domain-containing protein [Ignisphaera sp.]